MIEGLSPAFTGNLTTQSVDCSQQISCIQWLPTRMKASGLGMTTIRDTNKQ